MNLYLKNVVIFLLLSGCHRYPLLVVNGYFEEPVHYDVITGVVYSTDKNFNVDEWGLRNQKGGDLPFLDDTLTSQYDLRHGQFLVVDGLEFYQDRNRECFLFSYTQKELKQLKLEVGSLKQEDTILLINKNGLRAMSKKTYNKIKPSLIPYPYNPSLCKPRTTNKTEGIVWPTTGKDAVHLSRINEQENKTNVRIGSSSSNAL